MAYTDLRWRLRKMINSIPSKRVRANKEEIKRGIIQANLSPSQISLLRSHLDIIDAITKNIAEIDANISNQITIRKEDMKIALSMPGMGFVSASTILAEIGDFRDFNSPDKLAAYCGLVPSVYQSAGKLINGHITKHGSPHIRAMIVEVAHAIIRSNQSEIQGSRKEVLLENQGKKRHENWYCCSGQKGALHTISFADPSRTLSRWLARQIKKHQASLFAFNSINESWRND